MKPVAVLLALALLPLSAMARSPEPLGAEITRKIEAGADATAEVDALLAGFAKARDSETVDDYIDVIEALGGADTTSPQAVKQQFRAKTPPILREQFSKNTNLEWTVRSDLLMLHRALDASAADLRAAVALANADSSEQASFMQSRGELLQSWLDNRSPERDAELAAAPPAATPGSAAALSRARELGIDVSVDQLMQSAGSGAVEEVRALLDAGLPVDAKSSTFTSPLAAAVSLGCARADMQPIGANIAVMDLLIGRGANADSFDDRRNSILMMAVQQCPVEVIRKLLDAGATVNPVNAQDFTPLEMALVGGHIGIAELLVERGARRDRAKLDRLYAETPSDPRVKAVLAKAAGK